MEDDGFGAEAEVLDSKFADLKKVVIPVWERAYEHVERPTRLEALNSALNSSNSFLEKIKNTTLEDTPYTQVEIDTLDKLIKEITVRKIILKLKLYFLILCFGSIVKYFIVHITVNLICIQ